MFTRRQIVVQRLDHLRLELSQIVVASENILHGYGQMHVRNHRAHKINRLLFVFEVKRDLAQIIQLVEDPLVGLLFLQHVQILVDESNDVVTLLATLLTQIERDIKELKAARFTSRTRIQIIAPALTLQLGEQAAVAFVAHQVTYVLYRVGVKVVPME